MGMLLRTGLVMLLLTSLMGCSPDYNWRRVAVADGMVNAIFPDKPKVQQKTLVFEGHEVPFSLTVSVIDATVFAVGYAALPPALQADDALRKEMGKSVIRSFYQNLGVEAPTPLPDFGTVFDISGKSSGDSVKLRATTSVLPRALVEAIVTGPADSFPEQQANEFLNGLEVGGR